MIRKGVETDFAPGFAIKRRCLIQRKKVTLGFFAAVHIQHHDRFSDAPRRQPVQLERGICRQLHRFRREQTCRLMVPVARVYSAPPIEDHVRSERANHADHVLENLFSPDFFGFFRGL